MSFYKVVWGATKLQQKESQYVENAESYLSFLYAIMPYLPHPTNLKTSSSFSL
jgi:hypothetical protein